MATFHIINSFTGEPVVNPSTGEPEVWTDGQTAAAHVKELIAGSKAAGVWHKFKVKQVADTSWQDRELLRLRDGAYTSLPWEGAAWEHQRDREHYNYLWFIEYASKEAVHHYAHVSKKFPGNVAFTENAAKGERDLKTSMRPGKYLAKYYACLPPKHIERMAAIVAARFGNVQLKFAHTSDEIEQVYLNGPPSCMSHPARDYESRIHPVRVYGAGDLAVAYLANKVVDDEGEEATIGARCVCWPEKKLFGRIYGDISKLRAMLCDVGYREEWYFEGARLLRVERRNVFVVPYLDGGDRSAHDNGEFLIIQNGGEINCETTTGLCLPELPRCTDCGEESRRDRHVTAYGGLVCQNCLDQQYQRCDYTGSYYHELTEVITCSGVEYWGEPHMHEAFTCSGDGRVYVRHMEDVSRRSGSNRYSITWSQANPAQTIQEATTVFDYEVPDVVECGCRVCKVSHPVWVCTQTGEVVR